MNMSFISLVDCNKTCQKECLKYHNIYRKNHGAKPLELDEEMSVKAQEWSEKGIMGTSEWVNGYGGECWAYGNMYESWKDVVKVSKYVTCTKFG